MYLTGPQTRSFVEALNRAFSPLRFDQLLLGRLDKVRANITMQPDYVSILYDVVDVANKEGWALELLDAARASNKKNPHLLAFEEALGLGVIRSEDKANLERIVNERSTFHDPMKFRERLGRLESWVCAIETPGSGGTGFLVGPDLVLTNYHVIEGMLDGEVSPTNVRCRFDFKAVPNEAAVNAGSAVALANEWEVANSPYSVADTQAGAAGGWVPDELDFALIRLARPIGEDPIGGQAEPEAPNRDWLPLKKNPPAAAQNDVLFILQHPQDLAAANVTLQSMQLAAGTVMGLVGNGLRIRHNARTLPGSSGSPVFNASLEFVALHHAGEPNSRLDYRGAYNQAIPLTEIARYLSQNGLGEILVS